jgi:hypothetical protein
MRRTFWLQLFILAVVAAFAFTPVSAQGPRPLGFLQNIGKNVEADPNKEYRLTELDGPYLIYAAAFLGPTARNDANVLVLELRKTYKWNAYIHEIKFEFNDKDLKRTRDPRTGMVPKFMNDRGGAEYAVLIGNFSSLEDKQFENTLAAVRKSQPVSLRGRNLLMAFGVQNPMLPPEHQRGVVDAFIESINKDSPYSLLRNPGQYTVQIATFAGRNETESSSVILDKLNTGILDKRNTGNSQNMTRLEMGERAAVALCKTLRERGVEAYEFHDRYASIVTVGSFGPQHLRRLPNGTMDWDPQVQQVIRQFQGQVTGNSYNPVVVNNIECDLQPRVIEVPRPRRR